MFDWKYVYFVLTLLRGRGVVYSKTTPPQGYEPKCVFLCFVFLDVHSYLISTPFMVTGGPVGCWEHAWNKPISQCSSARLAFGPPTHARQIATCPLVVALRAPCGNGGTALPGSGTSIETAMDIVLGVRTSCKLPKVCSKKHFTKRILHFFARGCCCSRRRLLPLSPLPPPRRPAPSSRGLCCCRRRVRA